MIKGFRFTNQLSNAEVDARIHQEFLNKKDGVFYGMELSNTNNTITISDGLCELGGRPVAVVDSETVDVNSTNTYCLLVLEIDRSKESTLDLFNQVSFKIIESTTAYPEVTQQDINIYNGENNIYQLEFARFRTGSNGISEFQDTRSFLNFEGIYSEIEKKFTKLEAEKRAEYTNMLQQLREELAGVEGGSAYVLNNNIVTIYGKLIVQPEEDGSTDYFRGYADIEYPDGFNKNNTSIISIGIGNDNFTQYKYSFETLSSIQTPLSIIRTAFGRNITLKDENMQLAVYYNYTASAQPVSYTLPYKITLIRDRDVDVSVYQLGDVNMDGQITQEDADLVLAYDVGNASLTDKQLKLADVNGDGTVDTLDALAIQKMLKA